MSQKVSTAKADCGCHNLDDREVKKRQIMGYGSMVIGFLMVGAGKIWQQPEWVSAMPFVPFFFAYIGLLQARTRTCVLLALIDRDMSGGKLEQVSDRATGWRLKKRSLKLLAGAALLAALTAALCAKI